METSGIMGACIGIIRVYIGIIGVILGKWKMK